MKKSIALITCLALALALGSCGGNTDGADSKADSTEVSATESAVSAESAESEESVSLDDVTGEASATDSADTSVSEDASLPEDNSEPVTVPDDSSVSVSEPDDSSEDVSAPADGTSNPKPEPSKPVEGEGLEATYKWIKTWYNAEANLPAATVITSPAELTTYYLNNKSILTAEFKAHISTYEDGFFEDKVLILVAGREGSGSITHELTSAVLEGDKLTLTVSRVVPSSGTDNEMGWHLFAEIDKACLAGKDNIVINMVDE